MNLREPVIVAYGRSPVGKAPKGAYRLTHPVDIGAQTLKGVLARVPQLDPKDIDDVVAFLEISWEGELRSGSVNGVTTYYGSVVPVTYTNIRVYASCENTIRWIEENDLLTEEMKQEFTEKYGGAYFAWTN